jgi:hypothetical protein
MFNLSNLSRSVFCKSAFSLLTFLSTSFSLVASDVDITGGPTTAVCPSQAYTFTAQSSSGGCFSWLVYENGVWNPSTYPSGCSAPYVTSSTFTHTFSNTPQSNVKVQVVWRSPGGVITRSETRTLAISLPKPAPNLGAEQVFCGGNVTRTFTINGLTDNAGGCFYHYQYTYEAPSGWVATVVGGTDADPAANVVRSHSRTISLRSPVGAVNGKAGVLKIRTNHPGSTIQSESVIDLQVGAYTTGQILVSGTVAVCPGNEYTYTATPYGTAFNWTFPTGWTLVSQVGNQIRLRVPSSNPQYGTVRVSITNACGTSGFSGVTVYPCGGYLMAGNFKIYPNPADEAIFIEEESVVQSNDSTSLFSASNGEESKVFSVKIYNAYQEMVLEGSSESRKVELDTRDLLPGTYFIHIQSGKDVIREKIFIE